MSIKKNISRDDIANAINTEFGFSRKDCNDVVNNIIDIIFAFLNCDTKLIFVIIIFLFLCYCFLKLLKM